MRYGLQNDQRPRSPIAGRLVVMALAILIAGISVAAWKASASRQVADVVQKSPPLRGQYVSMPHPSNRETRRKAEFMARALKLPLIADANVTEITVKEFGK